MKRLIILLLAAVMLLSLLAPAAYAAEEDETTEVTEEVEETEEAEAEEDDEEEEEATEETRRPVSTATEGTCGDLVWRLSGNTLTITGSGEMEEGAPWAHLADKVEKLVLSGGITTVAAGAFTDFDELEVIDFGTDLTEIGEQAFMGCDSLVFISLPDTFRRFGPESFRDCSALKAVYCAGNMPTFKASCLYTGNHIVIYRPLNNPWPQEYVQQLQTNFGNRLEVLPGSGEDFEAFTKEQEKEAAAVRAVAAQAETEPVTEPVTEPATEPVTEPVVTEPETQPATQPATEPVTEAVPETTEEEFTGPDWREEMELQEQEREPEKVPGGRSWIGLVLIIGVLTFVVAGALIVRSMSRKGGRYTD